MPVLTPYQQTIHLLKYARWLPKQGRRETFDETVERFRSFMLETFPDVEAEVHSIANAVGDLLIAPSMRLFATAGAAVEHENLMAYNCMFMAVDSWSKLPQLMYALMCGTGVGFSVEKRYVDKLRIVIPESEEHMILCPTTFVDSRQGWADGFMYVLKSLILGHTPDWDLSLIRPKGAPLKTTGGYSSGPEPLDQLLRYTVDSFIRFRAQGFIRPIDIYDLCCKIADVVVQGGVRRSACIAIFSPDDGLMWDSKQDCMDKPWRFNTNNSVMFETEAQALVHMPMVMQRVKSSGEPGFLIRSVLMRQLEKTGRELPEDGCIGVNPCGEIILRDMQVCNLTEVVVRPEYSVEKLEELVELATIQGVLQSMLTHTVLESVANNCMDEPLLGVSLTGLADDPILMRGGCELVDYLRTRAHEVAGEYARRLGINTPKAITTVKPSGTVSKLMGCSPGIHPWYSAAYLNNISIPRENPLVDILREAGVPERYSDARSVVFSFLVEAPDGSEVDTSAIVQLENWRRIRKHWADHNVSCTIYVGSDEWADVEAYVTKNIGIMSGITFMQRFTNLEHCAYMPLETLNDEELVMARDLWKAVGPIDWPTLLLKYDRESTITASREISCAGGNCLL